MWERSWLLAQEKRKQHHRGDTAMGVDYSYMLNLQARGLGFYAIKCKVVGAILVLDLIPM